MVSELEMSLQVSHVSSNFLSPPSNDNDARGTTNSNDTSRMSNNTSINSNRKHVTCISSSSFGITRKEQQRNIKPSLSHQIQRTEHQRNKIIRSVEVTRRDLRLFSTNAEFTTITHHGNISKPTIIENPDNSNSYTGSTRQEVFESHYQKEQQKKSPALATLPQHHLQLPIQYTATAAEIALGITPPYGQNQTMGDGSRSHSMITHVDQFKNSDRCTIASQVKEAEASDRTLTDSITVISPGRMTPIHNELSDHRTHQQQNLGFMAGTPSTVSTAPSSDDEAALVEYKLDETSTLPNLLHPINYEIHSTQQEELFRSNDGKILHTSIQKSARKRQDQNPWIQSLSVITRHISHLSWDGVTPLNQNQSPPSPEQRVASFRSEENSLTKQQNHHNAKSQQLQQLIYLSPKKDHYSPQHFIQMSPPQANRRNSYAHHAAHKNSTPPRNSRNQRQQGNTISRQAPSGGQGSSPHQTGLISQRSPSEVLKTLLRKKACLYEPDTSRSVALVTWLVGRELAIEYGFFSRQQLQSGVHACVASKIESGTITRTKVNRCMQIILNSCFHYIIPRSDGTEEKGGYFRDSFLESVKDDLPLLKQLPDPWNDLIVDRNIVIDAIFHEEAKIPLCQMGNTSSHPSVSPKSSPKLSSINAEKNPDTYESDREKEEASKRAVLLCFNENVRSAEDVFRCHNDFIRDTANAAHLQLTAREWRQFFGRESSHGPNLWNSIGVQPVPGEPLGGSPRKPDFLGRMSPGEVGKFRSTWCTKRYDHDHDLCGFAHIEVNGGWLRRNPVIHSYKNVLCKFISTAGDKMISPGQFYLNECPKGVTCGYAHSVEEIMYHPLNYKTKVCTSPYSRSGGCRFGDVCSNVHPPDINRPFKKISNGSSPIGNRGKKHLDQGKSNTKYWTAAPSGSPVVYASPAPFSRYERQLVMPGLQNLYRRQSEVVRAYVRSSENCQCSYSLFGDNWAISISK